jgi:hypothetical protein
MPASKVKIDLTREGVTYLSAVLAGVLQGPIGNVKVNPHLRDLVNGVYHVLAGGTVKVKVTKKGDKGQVKTYKQMEIDSLKSSNEINLGHAHPIRVDI